MVGEALGRLSERINNAELILLMNEYLMMICTYLPSDLNESLAKEIDKITEVVIADRNDFQDGVWYLGGLNNNILISLLLLVGKSHEGGYTDIREIFIKEALERCMAILVSESFNEPGKVKEYNERGIKYFYTWDNKYAFAEDYLKRLQRVYEKVCNRDLVTSYFRKDFFTSFYEQLDEEEKRNLLLFLLRINKFAKSKHQNMIDRQARENFCYAWGNIQRLEEKRKIKPNNFYKETMLLG